jgi:redox-sensing transcriptional repressor
VAAGGGVRATPPLTGGSGRLGPGFPLARRSPTIATVPADSDAPTSRKSGAGPSRRIPEATVARLPVYQRILEEMVRSGTATVSSEVLAAAARVNASKVRKDLSLLGSFGTRGAGYDTAFLAEQIDRELGLDRDWPVVIAGIGNLGRALARSQGFAARNFRVAALLDNDPAILGTEVDGITVHHTDDLPAVAATTFLAIGVITTPASVAQRVADTMVAAGIHSILNFAPRVLEVPADVLLRYVDLSMELQVMSFYQARSAGATDEDGMPIIRSIGLTRSASE